MEAETTEIAAGVAVESAEAVTGIMTETGEAEVGEAGIGRAEDGGVTSRGRETSSSRLPRTLRESERSSLTWSFQVRESVGSEAQMCEGFVLQR
mgnify:CR=1 FL=1